MHVKKKIRSVAYSSIVSALITLLIIAGGFFDILDLACAAVASIIIHIISLEVNSKTAILIYAVSSVLSLILMPLRSCPILFAAFFGYYPVIRLFIYKKIKIRQLSYISLLAIYNIVMIALFLAFKNVFGIAGEPYYMYVLLLLTSNVFYISFELLMGRIMILYNYKIKKYVIKIIGEK